VLGEGDKNIAANLVEMGLLELKAVFPAPVISGRAHQSPLPGLTWHVLSLS
jgi:hypothetical protein